MTNPFLKLGKNQVVRNMVALSSVQAVNYLVPLIIMPIVVRSIGVDRFGVVVFMQSAALILSSICDYGFNITATRQITTHKGDTEALSVIVSRVLLAKLLLCFLIIFFIAGIHFFGISWFKDPGLSFAVALIVFSNTLLPTWFFQGVQKMRFITYWTAISKLAFLLLIILFIKTPADDYLVLVFFGSTGLVASIYTIMVLKNRFGIRLSVKSVSLGDVRTELKNGRDIFISNLSIVSIMNSNTVVLGFFTTQQQLGYYAIAEKIYLAIWQLCIAFSQAIFPTVCNLVERGNGYKAVSGFFRFYYIPFLSMIIFGSLSVILLADPIILFFTGTTNPVAAVLVRLLAMAPIVICLNMPANQVILACGFNSLHRKIYSAVAVINLALGFWLSAKLEIYGAVISILATQTMLTFLLYYCLHRYHRDQFIFAGDEKI